MEPRRHGNTKGNTGLLVIYTVPSLALCRKEVATVKEDRCIGGCLEGHFDSHDSGKLSRNLSIPIRLFLFQGVYATPAEQNINLSLNTLTWFSINSGW